MKLLILYDGTLSGRNLLRYGLRRAMRTQDEAVVLTVFRNDLFIGYDGFAAEATARKEFEANYTYARRLAESFGKELDVSFYTAEGNVDDALVMTTRDEHFDMVLVTPRYSGLQKRIGVPVAVIPGTLLVPVDSSRDVLSIVETVSLEAAESQSSVVLVGIIPIHLYSRSEDKELRNLREATEKALQNMQSSLQDAGVIAEATIRSGYPDDEILRAAAECNASMIFFPGGGKTPSELRKAAHVISSERARSPWPLVFVASREGA
ncbi:MAG TPA: universal stress protein [Dissulfurispiraceae bacterium]|nr:universal stress protein [Dissulfurispiraceae bacterium]